uniref:Uncharacterized protein n=1 Tax=Lactuca sativa TaxID=4236 RepID=A0A9R1WNR5_LACSA|nr:hypothetical protein LSAT_V11C100010700 [Lactuca sativa]
MPSLPAPIVIHILRATETSSRVQRFKTFSSFLDGENGLEALLDVTVAKFTPVNTDGESGEPTYIISDRSVESKRTLYTSLIEELEGLTSNYPNRFKVYYVLNPVDVSNPATFTQGHFGLFLISFVCLFQQASTTKSIFSAKDYNDHMALVCEYEGWKEAEREGYAYKYCWRNFLYAQTLQAIHSLRNRLSIF